MLWSVSLAPMALISQFLLGHGLSVCIGEISKVFDAMATPIEHVNASTRPVSRKAFPPIFQKDYTLDMNFQSFKTGIHFTADGRLKTLGFRVFSKS